MLKPSDLVRPKWAESGAFLREAARCAYDFGKQVRLWEQSEETRSLLSDSHALSPSTTFDGESK